MGLLKKIFGQKKMIDSRLIGIWISDLADELTVSNPGSVRLTFSDSGDLIYDVMDGEKIQRINMIFWTEGNIVISDQPSHPKKERTKFEFESDRKLILEFGGERTVFLRQ